MIKPEKQFFIFGMGNRKKFIYKEGGQLIDFETNKAVRTFDIEREKFIFDRYTVVIFTKDKREDSCLSLRVVGVPPPT